MSSFEKFLSEKCALCKYEHDKDANQCSFYINSKMHDYCFWYLVWKSSDDKGIMQELSPCEIAKLLGLTTSEVEKRLEFLLSQIQDFFKKEDLEENILNNKCIFNSTDFSEESSTFDDFDID